MAAGWIKLMRDADPELMAFLFRRPNALALLTLIAIRARRENGTDPRTGLQLKAGEALIGDYETLGITEKAYRIAKIQLFEAGITAYRRANRGTIAKIVNSTVYDINAQIGGEQRGDLEGESRGERRGDKQEVKKGKEEIPFSEIISVINSATGKNFRPTGKETQRHIIARWKEGYRLPDFEKVIRSRCMAWGADTRMAEYLRPETLFGPKFESYLNSALVPPPNPGQEESPFSAADKSHSQQANEIARRYGLG